jgi:hypothetical protein
LTRPAVDGLLVLQRSDVAHLAANRERFAGIPLLCTDPGILENVLQAGFTDYQLRRLSPGRDMPARVYTETLARATMIDLLLTRERERLWGPGCFEGWDRGTLFQPLHVMLTAQALRPVIEREFPEQRIGLLRPDNLLLFNFDSAVQAEIYAADARRWCFVDRYEAGRFWNPLLLNACFDADAIAEIARREPVQAITHLGSCFYDVKAFGQAISQAFANNIDLPSVYCDVPVRRGPLLLKDIASLPAGRIDESTVVYREHARQLFIEQLADLIPSQPVLRAQADVLARRCQLQAINFLGLKRALAGQRPHLVIADHDNGHLGPLFSLANALGSEITVMPHSGYTNAALPHAHRVTAIERDGYGARVLTLLGQHVATRAVRFRATAPLQQRPTLRKLCILVNTMFSDGQYHIDLFGLMALFKGLRTICSRHGAELAVRLKPSTPALNVVSGALGAPAEYFARTTQMAIDEVASDTDLCLAWGELTTGSINFLDAGSLVLHVSEEDWPTQLAPNAPFLHERLVRSMHVDQALAFVDTLLSQPDEYRRLQQLQSGRYAQRRIDAHDTFFPQPSSSPVLKQGA